jgi:hypothetical protein
MPHAFGGRQNPALARLRDDITQNANSRPAFNDVGTLQ